MSHIVPVRMSHVKLYSTRHIRPEMVNKVTCLRMVTRLDT